MSLALCVALTGGAHAQPEAFSTERIRSHVKTLASDAMEGRGTGQPGGDRAADYIAQQFASYGLKPAGDDGTYFQKVPLVGVTTLAGTTFELDSLGPLKLLEDFVVNNQSMQEAVDIDAPLVFVGFGISAPEYQWDDYKNVDLRGKVAVLFVNEPESDRDDFFKGKALTYYGRWTYKFEETARHGAIATIIIHRSDLASYGWDVVRNSWSSEKSYLKSEGGARLQAASWIRLEIAQALLKRCDQDVDQLYRAAQSREFRPIPLPARLKAHIKSQVRHFSSRNVLAWKTGAALKDQAIVYSAHYDHLGLVPGAKGDKIYNGAVDNASGCAVLLELARAYSSSQPARSVLFVSTTAEEQFLLGATYLAAHPPVPVGRISLDLNFDMLHPLGEPEEISANGAERTTFGATLREVAQAMSLQIRPDAHPEAGLYYRMDHFSLAQQGIPSFSISQGLKFRGHTLQWGEEQVQDYVAHRYHQTSDEVQPQWDFSGLVSIARFSFKLGMRAANQPDLVQWLPGDEFEAARLRSLAP